MMIPKILKSDSEYELEEKISKEMEYFSQKGYKCTQSSVSVSVEPSFSKVYIALLMFEKQK